MPARQRTLILAYRAALALRPDFTPAAINLGLLLEQHGDPQTALACWADALQTDAARIALLNQRARLMEQLGQLADAEATMRASLLIEHDAAGRHPALGAHPPEDVPVADAERCNPRPRARRSDGELRSARGAGADRSGRRAGADRRHLDRAENRCPRRSISPAATATGTTASGSAICRRTSAGTR